MKKRFQFRLWDKTKKQWFPIKNAACLVINPDSTDFCFMTNQGPYQVDIDRFVLQQSTGVKDINGKLIFEGDIIKILSGNIGIMLADHPKYTAGEIRWFGDYRVCQSMIGGEPLQSYVACDCCNQEIEIIGNIYENPELCHENLNLESGTI